MNYTLSFVIHHEKRMDRNQGIKKDMRKQIVDSKTIIRGAFSFDYFYGFFFTKEHYAVRQKLLLSI